MSPGLRAIHALKHGSLCRAGKNHKEEEVICELGAEGGARGASQTEGVPSAVTEMGKGALLDSSKCGQSLQIA